MNLNPIITSLLETDAYKFSMGNVIFKEFNNYTTTWTFKCRNEDVRFTPEMVNEIKAQIDWYCELRFKDEELQWLKNNLSWISEGYINYLKFWHPVREEIFINDESCIPYNNCGLAIEARGTWLSTSMYEIAILQIVNEVYFSFKYNINEKEKAFKTITLEKLNNLKNKKYELGVFSEFGVRRRLSKDSQNWLIEELTKYKEFGFVGTSNVFLAKKFNVKAVGTCAHEMAMAMMSDQRYNPAYVNERLMEIWTNIYGIKNGIYLTDVIGTDVFLKDFNEKYATLFSGVRHDSGDPITWGDKIINHYKQLGINPKTKTLLFSDSLNFEKATNIYRCFKDKCNVAFGIGTYLAGIQDENPLNIVMKVTSCNGYPVAKISDTPSKGMCRDNEYVDYLTRCIKWRLTH